MVRRVARLIMRPRDVLLDFSVQGADFTTLTQSSCERPAYLWARGAGWRVTLQTQAIGCASTNCNLWSPGAANGVSSPCKGKNLTFILLINR